MKYHHDPIAFKMVNASQYLMSPSYPTRSFVTLHPLFRMVDIANEISHAKSSQAINGVQRRDNDINSHL